MEELLEEYGVGNDIRQGDIVEGVIIGVSETEVTVNIGYRNDGVVVADQLPEKSTAGYQAGDKLNVFVQKMDNGEGLVQLSAIKALERVIWDEFQELKQDKTVLTLKVTEVVKGGLAALYKGFRVFIPASQVGLKSIEDFSEYVGKELEVVITDVTKEKRSVVASNKVVELEKRSKLKAETLAKLSVGDRINGVVARLESYGAFVDLGGVDGLLHVSQMSFTRIKHPSDVVSVEENVEVEVTAIDTEKGKISLKLTSVKGNPWDRLEELALAVDAEVKGKVLRIVPFGAFVQIEEGLEGLLHISQLSDKRVEKVEDVIQIGDEITVRILNLDKENKKIALSMREKSEKSRDFVSANAYERTEKREKREHRSEREEYVNTSVSEDAKPATLGELFRDKLSKFKK